MLRHIIGQQQSPILHNSRGTIHTEYALPGTSCLNTRCVGGRVQGQRWRDQLGYGDNPGKMVAKIVGGSVAGSDSVDSR